MRISDWSSDVCSSDLIERCGVLLHLIDATQDDVGAAYRTVRRELEAYGGGLAEKAEVVALNKVDALDAETREQKQAALRKAIGKDAGRAELLCLSGVSGERSEEHTSELQSLMSISYAVFCLQK